MLLKNILRGLFLLLPLFFLTPKSQATHIVGAGLSYECVNPTAFTYRVTLTLFRDAVNGQAGFDGTITVFIFRSNNGTLFTTRNVNLPAGPPDTLAIEWDACTGTPANIKTEFKEYEFVITLPPIFGGYDIAWARCCRNNTVTNINAQQGITVLAHVPGSDVQGCNSTPTFNQVAPSFLCVDQPFSFDHSATDPDGDSLVYVISQPYTGVNGNGLGATQFNPVVSSGGFGANPMGPPPYNFVSFVPGFTFDDPFASGNFSIDPQSGLLTLTPTQPGLSVFAVSVLEYRNGQLLSEIKRDFQIRVIVCSPQGAEPDLSQDLNPVDVDGAGNPNTGQTGNGILALSNDTIYALPTAPFCYNVSVQDSNLADTVELFPVSAAFGIGNTAPPPFATLTYTGTNPASGQVCWEVPCENEGDTIRLIVGGRDPNDCPGYNIVYDTTYVIIGEFNRPTVSHTVGGLNIDTIIVDPLESFCYELAASDLDTFDLLDFVPISGPFDLLGTPPPNATISKTGVNPITGQVCWAAPCSFAGKTLSFIISAQDDNYCNRRALDTVVVIIRDLPMVGLDPGGEICAGESFPLNAFGGTAYSWSPAQGLNNPNIGNPAASPAITTDYIVTITDSVGCPRLDTVTVLVNPLPPAEAGPDTIKCPGQSIGLFASGGLTYNWTPAIGLSNTSIEDPIANPDSTTTYTVTVTDAKGCENSDSVTVFAMYAFPGQDQSICIGDSVSISASGGSVYSWTPSASLIGSGTDNPVAFPTSTTTYTVTVTDSIGCTDVATLDVVVNPLPTIGFNATQEVCIGESLELIATGGVSYSWDPAPTLTGNNIPNPTVSPDTASTYTVTVTDANGCVNSDSVEVTVNLLPIADAGIDTVKCGDNAISLQASGGINYVWSPIQGLSATDVASPQANPDSSITYLVQVTDSNGCQSVDSVFVRAWYAEAGPDLPVCVGDSIALQASNGVAYNWDPSIDLINTGSPNAIAFPLDTTMYFVTITDTSGCQERDSMTVIVNPLPVTSTFGTDPYVCSGGGTVVNATGGIDFEWEPAAIFDDPTIGSPTAFPTYNGTVLDTVVTLFVTVIDTNGCRNFDSLDQTVRLLPIITVSNDTVKCPDDSVQLGATGGVSYAWNPPTGLSSTNIPNPFANPDTTTTYTGTVTAVWGCADSSTVTVFVIDPDAGPDTTICLFDSVQLLARGGVGYSWAPAIGLSDPNIANPKASPSSTTSYIVTVTDSVGCVDTDTMTVFVNSLPPSNAGTDDQICIGDSIQLSASGGIAFSWMPSDSISDDTIPDPIVFPIQSTDYIVSVTDTNGCVNDDTVRITVNPLPNADAGPEVVTKCGEAPIQLNASGGVFYAWSPAIDLDDSTSASPFASPDSNFSYTVTVTDTNGCVNLDSISILTMYAFASVSGEDTICFGESSQLSAGQIGGQVASYAWQPDSVIPDPSGSDPFVFPTTTTNFIVTVTDTSGCSDTATASVFVLPAPPAEAGEDAAVCIGESTTLNGSGGIAYLWSPGTFLDNAGLANPLSTPEDTITYKLLVTDINGCTAEDSVTIIVNPLPVVEAFGDTTICRGDIAFIEATGATVYNWTPEGSLSDPLSSNPIAQPGTNTTYTVLGIDDNGCQNTDEVVIGVTEPPVISGAPGDSICVGQRTELSVEGATTYLWNTGSMQPLISVAPGISTEYWVIPFGPEGCAGDTFFVDLYVERSLPRAEFDLDPEEGFFPLEVNFDNLSPNSSQYLWDFGDGDSSDLADPSHIYQEPGDYIVTLTVDNEIGCPDQRSFEFITVKDYNMFVPSAFSPNGDMVNDEFFIVMNSIEFFNIQIFDRWGNQVFLSDQVNFRWAGTTDNGSIVPEGVYVYRLSATTYNGRQINRQGSITVVR